MKNKLKQERVVIKIKKLAEEAKIPVYSHEGDAAFDICSLEEKKLNPGERYTFRTGIASEIPFGYVAILYDRSGLASKDGVTRRAGVIDAGYRGEWKIVIINEDKEAHEIQKGDRIAQAILHELPEAEIVEVDELSDSERGEGGFGSTGRK